jgi:glyoxylase-like metal-dependent hydrolase (beta-lactamase superfamily II)/rhodanese-related sulfurtransferase
MLFSQIIHEDLGCASYMVASTENHECVVIDPRWEIGPYLETAKAHSLRITKVIETHTHADHVSGHGRLAQELGVVILIHEAAGVDYPHQSVRDGDVIDLDDVRIHVLHTPGHRPEHIALAVEDLSRGADPWIVLTGDSLFVGDVARPDLAVDGKEGAALLFHSLHTKLLQLPEFAAVYPGHVAGSLCGRVNSNVSSTTIGFEKRFNEALTIEGEENFVRSMNENLPQRPPNMGRIVSINRGPLRTDSVTPPHLRPENTQPAANGSVLLDIRPTDEYLESHVKASVHVPVSGPQFGTRAGFVVSYETPLVLVARGESEALWGAESLHVVALDEVEGWSEIDEFPAPELSWIGHISVQDLHEALSSRQPVTLVDVREPSEWATGIIEGATLIPYRELPQRAGEVPRRELTAVMCGSGGRSAIGASLLERAGFDNLLNVDGGITAWREAGLPLTPFRPGLYHP